MEQIHEVLCIIAGILFATGFTIVVALVNIAHAIERKRM